MTDYEVNCTGCGTKSIVINTNVAWSFSPGANDYDVQSAMAHEFGHMLGFRHQHQASCTELTSTTCAFDSNKNTMNRFLFPGETCERTLSTWDSDNANAAYP